MEPKLFAVIPMSISIRTCNNHASDRFRMKAESNPARTGKSHFLQFQFRRGVAASDRVAPGRYLPGAPTDPYMLALEHTVPQITGSLRVDRASASCVRGPMGNAG